MKVRLILLVVILACSQPKEKRQIKEVSLAGTNNVSAIEKLSEWSFFEGSLKDLNPSERVFPYDLNSPLFSDYAQKARFFYLPVDSSVSYESKEVFEFPVGSVLIKNFFYPEDFANSEENVKLLETRLLIHEETGWNALTYIWNETQTEAYLEVAGASIPVSWTNQKGEEVAIDYSVPNLVQCKSCHEKSGKMVPIGPSARQLNRTNQAYQGQNQLVYWQLQNLINGLPDHSEVDKMPEWDNAVAYDLADRARAWLDVNCAHCHRKTGPAKNSGLYLTYYEEDNYRLGLEKPPVAAGRGSGGMKFGIVPGRPAESILVHRIESLDPGVMMPELGRKLRHEEGIALIRDWISSLKQDI